MKTTVGFLLIILATAVQAQAAGFTSQGAILRKNFPAQPAQKSVSFSTAAAGAGGLSFSSVFFGINLSGLSGAQRSALQSTSMSIGLQQSAAIVSQLKSTFSASGVQSLINGNPESFTQRMSEINSAGLDKFSAVCSYLTSQQTGTDHWRSLAQDRPDLFLHSAVDIVNNGGVAGYQQLCGDFDAYCGQGFTAEYLAGGNFIAGLTAAREAGVLDYCAALEDLGVTKKQLKGILADKSVSICVPSDMGICLKDKGLEQMIGMTADLIDSFGLDQVAQAMQDGAPAFFGSIGLASEKSVFDNTILQQGIPATVDSLVGQGYARADVEQAVKNMGVFALSRFDQADYESLLKNRLNADDQRPLAVIVGNKSDHNGSFNNNREQWGQLLDSGYYRVVYYEAGNEQEFAQALRSATADGSAPAELIMICGHGEQDSVRFGGKPADMDEALTIDFGDFEELKKQKNVLADNGRIFLISCNTARFGNEEKNIANMLADVFPQAKTVAAPKHESVLNSLIFDGQGRLEDVKYDLTTRYNAVEADLDFLSLPEPSGRKDYSGGVIKLIQVEKPQ